MERENKKLARYLVALADGHVEPNTDQLRRAAERLDPETYAPAPDVLYLEPGPYGTDRSWCEDDDPAGTGHPWTKYIKAPTDAWVERFERRLDDLIQEAMAHGVHPDEHNKHREMVQALRTSLLSSIGRLA